MWLLLFCLTTVGSAFAQPIEVVVQTIYADEQGEGFSEALEPLKDSIRDAFPPSYKRFDSIERVVIELEVGEAHSVPLPDKKNTTLQITYLSFNDEQLIELQFKLSDPAQTRIDTLLKLTPGAHLFQAGLSYKEGILIIAVEADLKSPKTDAAPAATKPD